MCHLFTTTYAVLGAKLVFSLTQYGGAIFLGEENRDP